MQRERYGVGQKEIQDRTERDTVQDKKRYRVAQKEIEDRAEIDTGLYKK